MSSKYSDSLRRIPESRWKREMTSILRRGETVMVTTNGVDKVVHLPAEKFEEFQRLLE